MHSLKVDTQRLRDSAAALEIVRTEFEDANENSDSLADAVGNEGLAQKIRDFAHNWDAKRKDFVEDIKALEQNLTHGADALDKTDEDLAHVLTNPSAAAAQTTSRGQVR